MHLTLQTSTYTNTCPFWEAKRGKQLGEGEKRIRKQLDFDICALIPDQRESRLLCSLSSTHKPQSEPSLPLRAQLSLTRIPKHQRSQIGSRWTQTGLKICFVWLLGIGSHSIFQKLDPLPTQNSGVTSFTFSCDGLAWFRPTLPQQMTREAGLKNPYRRANTAGLLRMPGLEEIGLQRKGKYLRMKQTISSRVPVPKLGRWRLLTPWR